MNVTDAKYRVIRGRRPPHRQSPRWLIWLAMTGFIGMVAWNSAQVHTSPPPYDITSH